MSRSSKKGDFPQSLTESWGTMSYHDGDETDSPPEQATVPVVKDSRRRRSSRLKEIDESSAEWTPQDLTALQTPQVRRTTRASSAMSSSSMNESARTTMAEEEPVLRPELGVHRSSSSRQLRNRKSLPSESIKTPVEEPSLIMPTVETGLGDGSWYGQTPDSSEHTAYKRKQRRQTPRPASSKPRRLQNSSQRADYNESRPRQERSGAWEWVFQPILGFLFSVLGGAINVLKPFISWLLAIGFVVGAAWYLRLLASSALSNALSPICDIPFASYLPICPSVPKDKTQKLDEFEELMGVQSAFETIITGSTVGATLPIEMKRSEASVRDLRHVVRYSRLPSRNEMHHELTGFIETARQASGDLTKFESRTGRSIDAVLSVNRWTLSVLEGIAAQEAGRSSVMSYISTWMYPLGLSTPERDPHEVLFHQYIRHTEAVEDQIKGLILEAQALQTILYNLDDRLEVIAGIAARDGISVQENRDELFAALWTKVGGNRASVAKLDNQLALLKHLNVYRKQAWNHVTSTLLQLQTIAAGLEDLRERVAAPEVLGYRDNTPLLFHLENIKLGVERLEYARGEGRRLSEESVRKYLDPDGQKMKATMVDNPPKTIKID